MEGVCWSSVKSMDFSFQENLLGLSSITQLPHLLILQNCVLKPSTHKSQTQSELMDVAGMLVAFGGGGRGGGVQ